LAANDTLNRLIQRELRASVTADIDKPTHVPPKDMLLTT
jgi:hypothetical protein